MSAWEAVIGLEVHVQVRTRSKLFCSCANRYGADPNTLVCPVCMGYPGVMPVPNVEAIRRTIAAGLMCGCAIARFSKFDRKSYFYPDMPKNYQISQYDLPFCAGGGVRIGGVGFSGAELPERTIGLTRIHLEEDVAKSSHQPRCSGIDFNRAGVPLMEIVSEPDMRTPDEAYAYLTALKQIMQYAGIGDCDMEKGQLRCDVNVSVRPVGEARFGTKIEIKNLNSFRSVHRSLGYEIERQQAVLEAGGTLVQETRAWNDETGETFLLRRKESAHDYRYFPEPDLMPMTFSDNDIEAIRAALPELPEARRARFVADFGLTPYDAAVLTAEKPLADYFEAAVVHTRAPKILANWIISELMRELGNAGLALAECKIAPPALAALVECIQDGTVSGRLAKDVFAVMLRTGDQPRQIIADKGLSQVSDEGEIAGFVTAALAANPAQVAQYRAGNPKVLQFLVGQVMKLSRGKANPQMVNDLLRQQLDG
jgi:aspartyl-tRNA(Asn)/glutamyl-tRNA(Gln) amidotransferase subunit B